ncbi:MAG: class I SAM-dependent methyltransferase [Patescibacteria group bacterium]
MNLSSFYNQFHKGAQLQKRIISEDNFTYIIIIKALKKIIKKRNKLSVLDYGCGVGTLGLYLANQGNKVIGLDISPLAVKTANENSKLMSLNKLAKFYTIGSEKKIISSKKFDLIICTEVLEHIKEDLNLLHSLNKKLKRNGKALITVPSKNSPLFKLGLARSFDKKVGHIRRYNIETISNLVISSGLEISEINKTEGIIRNSLFLFHPLGILIKLIKGPITKIVSFIDDITIPILGESDILIIARKK